MYYEKLHIPTLSPAVSSMTAVKETCGLFARIVGKVSVMTALQYINYINNKPIGRIKYALI